MRVSHFCLALSLLAGLTVAKPVNPPPPPEESDSSSKYPPVTTDGKGSTGSEGPKVSHFSPKTLPKAVHGISAFGRDWAPVSNEKGVYQRLIVTKDHNAPTYLFIYPTTKENNQTIIEAAVKADSKLKASLNEAKHVYGLKHVYMKPASGKPGSKPTAEIEYRYIFDNLEAETLEKGKLVELSTKYKVDLKSDPWEVKKEV